MVLITTILLAGLLALILYNLKHIKEYIRYRKLIGKLPGPETYPILGNIPDLLCGEVALFKNIRRWGQEYFPVYRITVGLYQTVNITGPEDFEAIAATTKNIQKNAFYKFFHLWIGEGLATSTGAKWQARRKTITPAFHIQILQQFMGSFTNQTDNLVKELQEVSHKSHVNIVPFISQFTLNVINETAMGVKLNPENEEEKAYCNAINKLGEIIVYRLTRPWLYINTIFYNFMELGKKERQFVDVIHNFTNKVVKERSKVFEKFEMSDTEVFERKKKMLLLDVLLNAKTNNKIDEEGIHDEVNTFIVAGYDTSSMSISFALMVLAQHKDVQELILQEINTVLKDSKPTYNDLQELKFMERCIKECMRLYPAAPLIGRVLEEDVKTSNGYILPKGTVVQIHIYDIHRNPKIWPNPEKFDPDRFLPENCQNRHPFAHVPFSAGPRNCIGQKFVMMEIKVALCGILRNFILEPVDTPDNIVLIPHIVLTTKDHILRVKLVPRDTK